MTPRLLALLALLPLAAVLLAAAWQDVRESRIPNRLVFPGALLGLLLNGLLPEGEGFLSTLPGALGWVAGLEGLGVGLALLLPLYWLGASGAGDVKLLAMAGAFLGPNDVFGAALAIFVAGGVMGLAAAAVKGLLPRLFANLKLMLFGVMVKAIGGQAPTVELNGTSVGKLPYAVAIATGTIGYAGWRLTG